MHWSLADVEQRQYLVILQIEGSHLRRAGAGHERLARVRQNCDVLGLFTYGQRRPDSQLLRIDQRDAIIAAIAHHDGHA
jgi:hypothetical protein